MYRGGGGRVGPSKTTPANTQCQKCLKRDKFCSHSSSTAALYVPLSQNSTKLTSTERHYSYECKAAPQERPYVPRPSRTQQLLNPKLRPELSNDTPEFLQKKSGVADAELAKKAIQREREPREPRGDGFDDKELKGGLSGTRNIQNRRESPPDDSSPSVRSISPASPRPERASPSPERMRESPSKRRSYSSRSDRSYSRSLSRSFSPVSEKQGPREGRSRDPSPRRSPRRYSSPDSPPRQPQRHKPNDSKKYPDYRDRTRSPQRHHAGKRGRFIEKQRQNSMSPRRDLSVGDKGGGDDRARQYRDRGDQFSKQDARREPLPSRSNLSSRREEAPRERSLSPFSRRLALTQAMNR